MTKHEQMNRIENRGIVAIIRADDASELTNVVDAIRAGGVDIVEVTMKLLEHLMSSVKFPKPMAIRC